MVTGHPLAAGGGRWNARGMPVPRSLSAPAANLRALAEEIAPARLQRQASRRWLKPALTVAGAAALGLFLAGHGEQFIAAVSRALHESWLLVILAGGLEAGSVAGYIVLQHRVVSRADRRLGLTDSYDIMMAGTVTTRLLPTAGLGGAALTVWALRARGVRTQDIAERLIAFLILLYAVYLGALITGGLLSGTTIGQVAAGTVLGAGAGAVLFLATVRRTRRFHHLLQSHLPVIQAALRRAATELRHPHPALLGAVAWWACDVAVLGAMLHAFGAHVPASALVLAYFLGTACNLLPLPGSLSGGLSGALVALGSPAGPALAGVLAYRALATWLPAASGIASLSRLRRSVVAWRAEAGSLA
jgi:putative heme transporter